MSAEEETANDGDDKNKLLAPEPPRWRFVNEAKSTSGYSSKYAGVVVSGISSAELGAKYVAPEIKKEVKVRTIEHFDLVPPDEKEIEQKKLREVGKLTIREWDWESEDFVGEGGLRRDRKRPSLPDEDDTSRGKRIDPSSFTSTYNLPDDSNIDLNRSMASIYASSSNGEGSNEYNHSEFDYGGENEKPTFFHSTPDRQKYWKRYRWMLFPLFLLFVIIGAVVGKKRSTEGNDGTLSIVPDIFVFEGNATASAPPSQSSSVILNPAGTIASPLFPRPTFHLPSLSPSITLLPSGAPSILPSAAPSGEPSSIPTAKPTTMPSFDPTIGPSSNPTLGPSMLPSNNPSVTPTQISSESSPPTNMGSDEPSLSPKPSPSPSHRPSSFPSAYPSEHPITSPSKQPIMFMGGCPEQFEPFTSYIIGQKVARLSVIYMCISNNCGSLLYTPGLDSGKWQETWEIVGACNGTNSPTITPSQFSSTTPTDIPSMTRIPTQQPIAPSIMPTLALETTLVPTVNLTPYPSKAPSLNPTLQPSDEPTKRPQTLSPTRVPTLKPVLGLTPRPTCAPQNGNFNVCIALDMSGSVCGGGMCSFCQPLSSCNSFGINQERCCNNFDNVLEFTKALVRQLGDLKTMQDFSLVHFATDAEIVSTLQNANRAIKTLQQVDYTGGSTNLGEGIRLCQKTLDSSTPGRKNFMVIVTDGEPTVPSVRPREVSLRAASAAKNKGTFVIPIFVEQIGSNDPAVALMKEISSDRQVFLTDFDSIVSLKDKIFEQVVCHA